MRIEVDLAEEVNENTLELNMSGNYVPAALKQALKFSHVLVLFLL
jgi:hypothetical protein